MSKHPNPRQIEQWIPPTLSQVVGCHELKMVLVDCLRIEGAVPNILISGESGTGKTSTVKTFVRTLRCPKRTGNPPAPCGTCDSCRNFDVRYRDDGIFATLQERVAVHGAEVLNFYPVNCGEVTETTLRGMIDDRRDFPGRFLIYLDEVHRLIRRKMDHLLLKPLEELDATWIASSALTCELDPMFVRRFSIPVATSLPAEEEMVRFLADRCHEWGIRPDAPETLVLLAVRSGRNVAHCLRVLARVAITPDRVLTRGLVQTFPFHPVA